MGTQRTLIIWFAVTIVMMSLFPFAIARFASECSGMAFCMILFFIINPIYSAVLGFRCGKDVGRMWKLPLVSAIAFLVGTWIFFDIHELWFIAYAIVYLIIGWIAMAIGNYLYRRLLKNQYED